MTVHSNELKGVTASVAADGSNTWQIQRQIIITNQTEEVAASLEALVAGTPQKMTESDSDSLTAWCVSGNAALEARVKVGGGEGLLFNVGSSYSNAVDAENIPDANKSDQSAASGGGDAGGGGGKGGGRLPPPSTTTSFISRMVPFPAANSCGDPFDPPLEQEKFAMKLTTTETIPVDADENLVNTEAMNDATESVGHIDPDFDIPGLNIPEGSQALCTQNDLGPIQYTKAGMLQTKTTTHVIDKFNPVELLDVGYRKCDGTPHTVKDPATGFEIPIVGPMAITDAVLQFDVFPIKGE